MKRLAWLLVLLLLLSACQQPTKPSERGLTLTLSGLSQGDITLSVAQLQALPVREGEASGENSSGRLRTVTYKGATLSDILAQHDTKQEFFGMVRLEASDGYSIAVSHDILAKREVIIAYETNGEAGDLRTVVPDERAMYWVKNLSRIELVQDAEAVPVCTVAFLENLPTQDVEGMRCVTAKAMLSGDTPSFIVLEAIDGIRRTERLEDFRPTMLLLDGEGAPRYTAPDMPAGMQIKGVYAITLGDTVIISLASAAEKFGTTDGVALSELLPKGATTVIIESSIGETELSGTALADARLTFADDGSVTCKLTSDERISAIRQITIQER